MYCELPMAEAMTPMLLCRSFMRETGLEPATSGVTGRIRLSGVARA
jgi:hypothetical protein